MQKHHPIALFLWMVSLSLIPSGLLAQDQMLLNPKAVIQQYQGESFCTNPMRELDFEAFRQEIERLPSEQLRFEKIRVSVGQQCLVTPYLFRLMQLFTNPTLEYDMLRLCFYYTFDLNNYEKLIPYMQGQVYQDRMKEFLNERNFSIRADVEGKRELVSNFEMKKAISALQGFTSDRARVQVAKQFVSTNNMRSEQFRDIVQLIKLNKGKLELVKYGYQYIYDPVNYFAVYENLRRADRQEIEAMIRLNQRSEQEGYTSSRSLGCTYLVSKSEFEVHKRSIQAQRYDADRLRYAKSLFGTYCFNVNELKDCLALFDSDADRRELAAHAFGKVYDGWNFYLVSTSFRSQSTVERLFSELSDK
ncbi:MAG: DUF4476 domain-containing protein [Bacteroidota bacterium]